MVNFLPFASPKTPTSKNLFPTPSTKIIPVSPPYLPIGFMLFRVCLTCCLCYLTSEWKCLCYWLQWKKNWLYSSHELDAQCSFICIIKLDPLWLRLWCLWLDECFGLEVSPYVMSHGKLSTRSSSHSVDIMCFCLWMLIMLK